MKHLPVFYVFIGEESDTLQAERIDMLSTITKQPPLVEDLRSHSSEQLAELRILLSANAPCRPDPRRPGFFEVEGISSTYYVFKYPTGAKVLLLGIWQRDQDPVAQMVAYAACPAA